MTPSYSNGPSGKRPDLSKLPDFNLDDINLDDIELFEQDFDDIEATRTFQRSGENEDLTREFELPIITKSYSGVSEYSYPETEALDARYSRAFGDSMPPKRNGKRIALIVGGVFLVLLLAVVGVEAGFNAGRIHRGVSVNGIDVGGMTVEDATVKINSELGAAISAVEVDIVPNAETAARLGVVTTATEADPTASATSDVAGSVASTIWAVDASTLGVTFDGAALAEKAFEVGRGSDFFKGRVESWFGGTQVDADLAYDETLFDSTVNTIDSVLGIPMVNGTISISADGVVGVVPGSEGECIDPTLLRDDLTETFLSGTSSEVMAPMMVEVIDIDEAEAAAIAQMVQAAITDPITFTYEGRSWEATTASLGTWIKARVEG
ncbi:MAG: hypothetical protein HGA54_09655, partial [Actinobacteria bacterium]|nr:hypothetical protein [Actinomycetota bacterium]